MFEKRKAAKAQARKDAEQTQRDVGLRQALNELIGPNGDISEEGTELFLAYCDENGYVDEQGILNSANLPPDVANTFTLGLANAGRFVESTTTLLLKAGEVAYCEKAAGLLKEVAQREFRGGSRGVSVPLGHGIRYRAGAVRGHMVTIGTEWQTVDAGMLTVTDQRVVYHGGRKTLEFQFAKLATLNTYSDAIDLGVTNRQTTSSFRVDDPEFVAGMIRAAFNARSAAGQPPR